MAYEIYSKEVALEVNNGTPSVPDWKLVICTISKTLDKSMSSTTINNDCNPDFVRELPTDGSWTMSAEGNMSKNPGVNEVSSEELSIMQDAKAIKEWRLRSLDGTYYRKGEGWINSLSETGSSGEYMTYSIGITGTTPISHSETT